MTYVIALVAVTGVMFFAGGAELVWRRVTGNRLTRDQVLARRQAARTPFFGVLPPLAALTIAGVMSGQWVVVVVGGLGCLLALLAYLRRRRIILSTVNSPHGGSQR